MDVDLSSSGDESEIVRGYTKLWFGKYKDMTVDEVAVKDPSYLLWAHENVAGFTLPKELYDALEMDERGDDYGLTREDLFGD